MNGAREYYDLFKKIGEAQDYKLKNVTPICRDIRGYGRCFTKKSKILCFRGIFNS